MNSLLIHASLYSCFCCKNSYLFISSFYNSLSTRNCHSENMFSYIDLLLKPSQCMNACSITGKDNNICSSIKKPLYSNFCKFTNFIPLFISIWSIFPVHFKYHIYFWKNLFKVFHDSLSTKSRIKKSDTKLFSFFHKGRIYKKYNYARNKKTSSLR